MTPKSVLAAKEHLGCIDCDSPYIALGQRQNCADRTQMSACHVCGTPRGTECKMEKFGAREL